jgi:hypothetical protein
VPETSAFSPRAFRRVPDTDAIPAVKGTITASFTGRDATMK